MNLNLLQFQVCHSSNRTAHCCFFPEASASAKFSIDSLLEELRPFDPEETHFHYRETSLLIALNGIFDQKDGC